MERGDHPDVQGSSGENQRWFTRNQKLLRLSDKSLRERPGIVILRSGRAPPARQFRTLNWDIGRASSQAAHYDTVYAPEREVLLGLVQDYPSCSTPEASSWTRTCFRIEKTW